jgi:hypothetical protein
MALRRAAKAAKLGELLALGERSAGLFAPARDCSDCRGRVALRREPLDFESSRRPPRLPVGPAASTRDSLFWRLDPIRLVDDACGPNVQSTSSS